MQYWTCPLCGANLDRGEKCDCQNEEKKKQRQMEQLYKLERGSNQFTFIWPQESWKA